VAEIRSGTHTARQESARHLYQPTCTVSHTAALISARFFCRCTHYSIVHRIRTASRRAVACALVAVTDGAHRSSSRSVKRPRQPEPLSLSTSGEHPPGAAVVGAWARRGEGRRRRGIVWPGGEGRMHGGGHRHGRGRLFCVCEMRGGTSHSGLRIAPHMHAADGVGLRLGLKSAACASKASGSNRAWCLDPRPDGSTPGRAGSAHVIFRCDI
jgi:hypothetical protein